MAEVVTSDEGTSYCPSCEELARERDRYREALAFIADNAPPECATAARIARAALAPSTGPEAEGEDG